MNRRRFVPHAFFVYGDDGSEDFVRELEFDYQGYPVPNLLNRKNMYQKISFIIKEVIYLPM